jgi:membrane-associated phospholipid phosphatase
VLAGSPLTGSGASALHKHAQVLALVNLAMADAGICCWEAKYRYNVLRPFQGIREGFAAGNPGVITDVLWLPLGRPGPPAGSTGPTAFPESTTPNFPAYVSGHSTFGTATFAMLRKIYGTDTVPFQLTSAQTGTTRSYASFSEAHDENGRSRVFLGVHWSFDDQEGQTLGQRVADHIWDRSLLRS